MTGLNLAGVRGVLDRWLDGSIVLVTTREGAVAGELNEQTGRIEKPTPVQIHQGPGAIVPIASTAGRDTPDPAVAVLPADPATTHRLLMPLSAPDTIRVGHRVEQTSVDPTMGDVSILGVKFRVTEVPESSAIAVLRLVFLKAETRGVDT